jgi:integrase
MSKSEAKEKLAEILRPINNSTVSLSSIKTVEDFVKVVFFPRKEKRWRGSTKMTTEGRVRTYILAELGARRLRDFTDDDLQAFLDNKTALSRSVVDHLKWDLVDIFGMAKAKGSITDNPADPTLLVTPKQCKKKVVRNMTPEEVDHFYELVEREFPLPEKIIVKGTLIAGMRPGETFGLKRGDVAGLSASILRRVYKGDIDVPKNGESREAALSSRLSKDLADWLAASPDTGSDGWLFPSENLKTPL